MIRFTRATPFLLMIGLLLHLGVKPALSQGFPASTGSRTLDLERVKANENVVSIISGNPNGGYLTIAHDIAAVVDDGDDVRVLPIVGKGAVGNMRDVLFLKGVDMGLVNTVTLNNYKRNQALGRYVSQQVVYITRLFEDEFHLLVRPEINELKDLEGKEVNFSDAGSGAQLSAQLMFAGFGVKPKEANMGQADAIEKMKRGEMFGTICTCLKPLRPYQAVSKGAGLQAAANSARRADAGRLCAGHVHQCGLSKPDTARRDRGDGCGADGAGCLQLARQPRTLSPHRQVRGRLFRQVRAVPQSAAACALESREPRGGAEGVDAAEGGPGVAG